MQQPFRAGNPSSTNSNRSQSIQLIQEVTKPGISVKSISNWPFSKQQGQNVNSNRGKSKVNDYFDKLKVNSDYHHLNLKIKQKTVNSHQIAINEGIQICC